ncbi:PEP/pyruvate-binding domain-containing protein [Flavobacterium sp. HJJ]|uniref:PEP/pyruvate-binding domain-containing protein n=1 Tax=Flavobacterium sp. HJJ TaxID=2783792 RepID=UPI00188A3347|nr:PEP/pyruvate-binding domain-containing protein [Flavobacterium sp. HJJ]MBF4470073.1 pyruvate, phosphate dikinase [Flavobacterium sp. HJJ]
MKKSILLFLLFFTITGKGQNFVADIPTYEVYKSLKGKPLSDKFSNIESVKIVYDLKWKKLYYFNSGIISHHYQFVTEYLGYSQELTVFNTENYSSKETGRDYLLGNLNHIKGTDKWIFELAVSDKMPVPVIEKFFKLVQETAFMGKSLQFYLNDPEKTELYRQGRFKIPCVDSKFIFSELKYQEVSSGNCIGILKEYKIKDLNPIKPKENEIVVLDGTPEVLPNVKGIIVNELQTPLSHLVILGKNRKIPIMGYTMALTDSRIKSLLNKKVELQIAIDTFYIKETDKKIKSAGSTKKRKLVMDTTVTGLVDLSKINKKGVESIGSKAQNLSYLIAIAKDSTFKVPENAYAIPFYYYNRHIHSKTIFTLINELINNPNKDVQWINIQLEKIRKAIKKKPIDADLITALNEKLGTQKKFKNFRFRSSTNAEDIDGFNGAGLYESKTGIVGDSIKSFEKAIKQVWASVWNESSYWEREIFGIDQNNIAMGVLVHRSFPDELVNGVVITTNLFRKDFEGITVNVQKGENSVVKPNKGEICEQFTAYDLNIFGEKSDNVDVDYISNSSLNDSKPLLSIAEINNLFKTCKKIESKMNRYWNKFTRKSVDIEFKIVGEKRNLYIKQVRVFND